MLPSDMYPALFLSAEPSHGYAACIKAYAPYAWQEYRQVALNTGEQVVRLSCLIFFRVLTGDEKMECSSGGDRSCEREWRGNDYCAQLVMQLDFFYFVQRLPCISWLQWKR